MKETDQVMSDGMYNNYTGWPKNNKPLPNNQ